MQPQSAPIPQTRDPDESRDLRLLMAEVVPDYEVWEKTPNPVLGGKRPMDLINSPQESILRDLLRAAKHGMMS